MTWTDLSAAFGYGTKLTSANMQQLRDNIAAAFAKDSGSPELATDYIQTVMIEDLQVTEAKLAASVYGQGKVKSSTGTATGSLNNTDVDITMQDYCFFPSITNQITTAEFEIRTQSNTSADTTGRFNIHNGQAVSRTYDVDWRYITASDEPFIFALKNKLMGNIQHLWVCDDPPPGYWGLDDKPNDFIVPITVRDPENYDDIVLFKQEQLFLDELRDKRAKDKKSMLDVMNDGFEYDNNAKLFKSKNLVTV